MLKTEQIAKTAQQVEPIMVTVSGVTAGTKDYDIIDYAMAAAGETQNSLYGWSLVRYDDGISVVRLNRD